MKDLIIIGAGDTGREAVELAERLNKVNEPEWRILGYVDDNSSIQGSVIEGYTVLGTVEYLNTLNKETYTLCAIGNGVVKRKILEIISNPHIKYATLIDPSVHFCKGSTVGEGSLIYAGVALALNATIGKHVYISFNCSLGHDCVVEDYSSIYPGVNISGKTVIHRSCEIGTGVKVIQGLEIGENATLGAGAVVVKDMPANCIAVGIPAVPKKFT